MRIIKSIPHPSMVVEIFHYAEKYTLKIKHKGLEQSFPIPSDLLESVIKMLEDPSGKFYLELDQIFKYMHRLWGYSLRDLNQGLNEQDEEII